MNLTRDTLFEILRVSSTDALIKCSNVCESFNKVTIYDYLWKQKCYKDMNYRLIKQLYRDSYMDCYIKWYKLSKVKSTLKYTDSVYKLYNLQELYLYDKQISKIPKEIDLLQNLQLLHLNRNQIKEIPKEIGQLQNLQALLLSNNQISEIPKEISQLQNLQYLYLFNNQISEIPKEIGQLQNLYRLELSNNQINEIPEELKLMNISY